MSPLTTSKISSTIETTATASIAIPTRARRWATSTGHPPGVPPKQEPGQADRGDEKSGRNDGSAQGDQVHDPLELRQLFEAGLKRQGQQESGEQLNAGWMTRSSCSRSDQLRSGAAGVSRRWPVSQALSVFGAGSFVPSG
ncbi:MAG TPA: hypothetical protein VES60_07170 [Nakamurella sp.]|nr:hypothetical protein [Nakamurella sp.]